MGFREDIRSIMGQDFSGWTPEEEEEEKVKAPEEIETVQPGLFSEMQVEDDLYKLATGKAKLAETGTRPLKALIEGAKAEGRRVPRAMAAFSEKMATEQAKATEDLLGDTKAKLIGDRATHRPSDIRRSLETKMREPEAKMVRTLRSVSEIEALAKDPNYQPKGYIEQLAYTSPQIALQAIMWKLGGPGLSSAYMTADIMGATLENFDELGLDEQSNLSKAFVNAVVQGQLERIGFGKLMKGNPLKGKLMDNLVKIAKGAGEEGFTEFVQAFPDAITMIMAQNPDKGMLQAAIDATADVATWQDAVSGMILGMTFGGLIKGYNVNAENRAIKRLQKLGLNNEQIDYLKKNPFVTIDAILERNQSEAFMAGATKAPLGESFKNLQGIEVSEDPSGLTTPDSLASKIEQKQIVDRARTDEARFVAQQTVTQAQETQAALEAEDVRFKKEQAQKQLEELQRQRDRRLEEFQAKLTTEQGVVDVSQTLIPTLEKSPRTEEKKAANTIEKAQKMLAIGEDNHKTLASMVNELQMDQKRNSNQQVVQILSALESNLNRKMNLAAATENLANTDKELQKIQKQIPTEKPTPIPTPRATVEEAPYRARVKEAVEKGKAKVRPLPVKEVRKPPIEIKKEAPTAQPTRVIEKVPKPLKMPEVPPKGPRTTIEGTTYVTRAKLPRLPSKIEGKRYKTAYEAKKAIRQNGNPYWQKVEQIAEGAWVVKRKTNAEIGLKIKYSREGKPHAAKIADQYGLEFNGWMPAKTTTGLPNPFAGFTFTVTEKTDPRFRGKESTFTARTLEDIPAKIKQVAKGYGFDWETKRISPIPAAAQLKPTTKIGDKTLEDITTTVEQGKMDKTTLQNTLATVGKNQFQDYLNPAKLGARIVEKLAKQGKSFGDAYNKVKEVIVPYDKLYNEVLQELPTVVTSMGAIDLGDMQQSALNYYRGHISKSLDRARKLIPQLMKDANVTVVARIEDMPDYLREGRSEDMAALTEITKEGHARIFIIANRSDALSAQMNLWHELGHLGLRRNLGSDYNQVMDKLVDVNRDFLQNKLIDYGYQMPEKAEDFSQKQYRNIAEEMLVIEHANLESSEPALKRSKSKIRNIGIRIGIQQSKITDTEIQKLFDRMKLSILEQRLDLNTEPFPELIEEVEDLRQKYPVYREGHIIKGPQAIEQAERFRKSLEDNNSKNKFAKNSVSLVFSLNRSMLKNAIKGTGLSPASMEVSERISEYTNIDKAVRELVKAQPSPHKRWNAWEINAVLQKDPKLLNKIKALEKKTGVKVLENDRIVTHPIERLEHTEKKQTPKFGAFTRSFTQTYLDRMNRDLREEFRKDMIRYVETAYNNASKEDLNIPLDKIQKTDFAMIPAVRAAEKTIGAINLNSMCPMFMVGNHGCYFDGCYVTGMGMGGNQLNFYDSAMYVGELLQLDQESINQLNKAGGLRMNGTGDLTIEELPQMRDIVKHADMRNLNLKIITKNDDTFELIDRLMNDDNPEVRKGAERIIVQPSIDPYWIPVTEDDLTGSAAQELGIPQTAQKGTPEALEAAARLYKQLGRDAKVINGQLYRKYGFSFDQLKQLGKKYPKIKIQPRVVVGTPKEIAEYALKAPQILQTWMHAKIRGGMYSDVEGKVLSDGDVGNYTARISVAKDENGEWRMKALAKKGTTLLKEKRVYTETEEYIKKNYSKEKANMIFNVLAGQMKKSPSALCCAVNASTDACALCTSHCATGTFHTGEDIVKQSPVWDREIVMSRNISNKVVKPFEMSMGSRFVRGAFDRFLPLKEIEKLVDSGVTPEMSPYISRRMLSNTPATIRLFLQYGNVYYDQESKWIGVSKSDENGLYPMISDLGENAQNFFDWMQAISATEILDKNDATVAAGGKSRFIGERNLFGKDDQGNWKDDRTEIAKIMKRVSPEYIKNKSQWDQYRDQLHEINNYILNFASESGLISAEEMQMWKRDDYIPFNRVIEDLDNPDELVTLFPTEGPRFVGTIHKLSGGKQQVGNPITNLLNTYSYMINESLKNLTMQKAVEVSLETGLASKTFPQDKSKQTVMIRYNGKPYWFRVSDTNLFNAMVDFGEKMPTWLKIFNIPKKWLTASVTLSPSFRARNIFRDTLHAFLIKKNFTPFKDTIRGAYHALTNSKEYVDFMSTGGAFTGAYHRRDIKPQTMKEVQKVIKRTQNQQKNILRKMWEAYDKMGEISESANRMGVYLRAREAGKSRIEAGFESKDLLDFHLSGKWGLVNFMINSVPFLGARLQGMYRAGRAFTDGQNRASFLIRSGMYAIASAAMALAYLDEEKYKELPGYDKWNNVHLFLPEELGGHMRFPIPFELGLMSIATPQVMVQALSGDEDGKYVAEFLKHSFGETLSFDPTPQLAKPFYQQYANRDAFTGRPIVPRSQEYKLPPDQFDDRTSKLAVSFAHIMDKIPGVNKFEWLTSPLRVEQMAEDFFAYNAQMAMVLGDDLIKWAVDAPEDPAVRRGERYLSGIGSFLRDDIPRSTRYQTEFYEIWKETDRAYASYRAYIREGLTDKAKAIYEKHKPKLVQRKYVDATAKHISVLNQQIKLIERSQKLTGEEKRDKIEKILLKRNEVFKKAVIKLKEK